MCKIVIEICQLNFSVRFDVLKIGVVVELITKEELVKVERTALFK